MAFRNIVVQSPAHISLKNHQLIIHTDTDHPVPVEDISALLLESRQSTITTAALSSLGQCGCAVFVCDEKHMPCAVLEPYSQHSRMLSVLKGQLAISEPLKKRLWQSIIVSKIRNQALCLRLTGLENDAGRLEAMSETVRSGDTGNTEATAAMHYFPALFGYTFTRSDESGTNAALNYGYAILRGCMARHLAVYGFLPAYGLHHRSELNAFNLTDDLMEPFRPVVDLYVSTAVGEEDSLTPLHKRALFNLLNMDILSGGQHHSVSYAMERTVQSLSRSIREGAPQLLLPELLPLSMHRYE